MRSGRFQKQMLPLTVIESQIEGTAVFLSRLADLWQRKIIRDADFVGIYLIYFAWLKRPRMWKVAEHRHAPRGAYNEFPPGLMAILPDAIAGALSESGNLVNFFTGYRLRSVPENARVVMQKWLAGSWSLGALTRLASDIEMLESQAQGKRLVTVFIDRETLLGGAPHGRDVFSFALHDLMHAYEFFHHPESRASQIGLYGLFLKAYRQGLFEEILQSPARESLLYVFSDLNAYAIHMLRAFKGVLKKHYEELNQTQGEFEAFFSDLLVFWTMPQAQRESLLKVTPDRPLTAQEERNLMDFFMRCA